MATDHIIVAKSVAAELRAALEDELAKSAEGSALPKVVSVASKERLQNMLSRAGTDGAEASFGSLDQTTLPGTSFVPTVLEGLKASTPFWEDESFGPVVALSAVESADEAVDLANGTGYGLSASVFTKDLRKGLAIAKKLETG